MIQAIEGECPLFLGEHRRLFWSVRQHEEDEEADED